MENNQTPKVVHESEWMTVYELPNGETRHESKFLSRGLVVSAESIKARWNSFSQDEKYDFVRAYQAKAEVTPEDEKVLNFLMSTDDHVVWVSVAPLLGRHRDRQRALTFLLDKIQQPLGPKSNFYQAIEEIGDKSAVPGLLKAYKSYQYDLKDNQPPIETDYLDYLQCCKALLSLEGSDEYGATLRRFAKSSNETVRQWAEMLLVRG